MDEVVDVMRDNVSKMMEREEKLSDIGQDRLPFYSMKSGNYDFLSF